jgi:hypothetical protein
MAARAATEEDAAKAKSNPTETLLKWLNDNLRAAGSNRVVKNLSQDISVCAAKETDAASSDMRRTARRTRFC